MSLEVLFRRWARRNPRVRWWVGARPDGRAGQQPRLIAARLGYPTAADDPFDGLFPVDRAEAERIIAVAGTTSLAYGSDQPRPSALADAAMALEDWDAAVFLGNGRWTPAFSGWQPMTDATFDAGVLGYDATRAFIFWVEEED